MATNVQNYIKPPEQFNPKDDLEKFIIELKRFIELTQQPREFEETLVKAFLAIELLPIYEATEGRGFEEKLRKAFEPKMNLAADKSS